MASSTKGSGQEDNPARHFGRGFASMDPERQREIANHRVVQEREAANEEPAEEARDGAGKGADAAAAQRPRQQNHGGNQSGNPTGGGR